MHKIFANSLFLGKKVVFLPQCHSTNEEMVQMVRINHEPEGLIVFSDHQQSGKGQRGNSWIAEPAKNILMSALLRPRFLSPSDGYLLNLAAALAVVDAIERSVGLSAEVKWPNDVYVNQKKCAGILIETNISRGSLEYAVVGVGLNVNQEKFGDLPATSLKREMNSDLDRWAVMEEFVVCMEVWYQKLRAGREKELLDAYHEKLRWRGESHIFASSNTEFEGKITGIDRSGHLIISTILGVKTFDVKEVQFIR